MRFNVAFIVLASLSLVLAQEKHDQSSTSAQAPAGGTPLTSTAGGAGGAGAGDMGAMISKLPKCFSECATKAATSATVGCTGLTDVACLCSKPQFSNVTMVCISSSGQNDCGALAQNRTALQQGQQVFEGICKAAGAADAGGASGSSGSMAGMPGMSNSTSASGSASGSGSSTSSTSAPPAGHNGAVIQHVATGSIVFTALLAGAATLL